MTDKNIASVREAVKAVLEGDMDIMDVPEEFRYAVYMEAVSEFGCALQYAPESLKTAEICLAAVRQSGRSIQYVPENLKTAELYMEAVKANKSKVWRYYDDRLLDLDEPEFDDRLLEPDDLDYAEPVIQFIPPEHRTAEICLEAVGHNGLALHFVPEKIMTAGLCLAAVRGNGRALRFVPENLKTAKICLEACRAKSADPDEEVADAHLTESALEYVPDGLKTPEVCLAAIGQSDLAFRHIPKIFWDARTGMEVVKLNGYHLCEVPENHRSAEVCMEAVKSSGYALWFVPKKLRTQRLCMEAAKQDGFSLRDVPRESRTAQICLEAVRRKGENLAYVPENLKTAELCREAVASRSHAFRHVPDGLKTAEMCAAVLKGDAGMFKLVPDALKTAEMCMDAVKHDGRLLWYVPREFRTARLCMEAVKSGGAAAFMHVPEKIRSKELCLEAAKRGCKLELLPPEFAAEAGKRAFTLKDIVRLDGIAIAKALPLLDSFYVSKALKPASDEVREKFFANMSKCAATMLQEDMEYMGPLRVKDAEDAAGKVCAVFLDLEAKGEIVIPPGCGEENAAPPKAKPASFGAVVKAELESSLRAAKDAGDANTTDRIETCLSVLDEKLPALLSRDYAGAGGVEYVNEVLSLAERGNDIFEFLGYENPELAEEVAALDDFADLVCLSDRDMQKVMREVNSAVLAAALCGMGDKVREKIFRNMSKRAATLIKEDIERAGANPDVAEDAREKILSIVARLEEAGEILVARYSGDQWVM